MTANPGGKPDAGQKPDAATQPMGGEPVTGRFTVSLIAADPTTSTPALSRLQGTVRSGSPHELMGWELDSESAGCRLETPDFPFCDPECAAGEGCVAGDTCEPDPTAVGVGTVTIESLRLKEGSGAVQLMRIGPNYQPPGAVDIDFPPADEGAMVTLSAGGSDNHGPFSISTTGIAEIVPTGDGPVPFERGKPLTLRWTPATSAASTMTAVVDISHHGGVKGRVICTPDDTTGELVVPAELVTGLYDLGVAGFPIVRITRAATGVSEDASSRIEFAVEQTMELDLAIPGVTSCLMQEDCPAGTTCQRDRTCG